MIGEKEIEKVYERLNSIDHVVMPNSQFNSFAGAGKQQYKTPQTAAAKNRINYDVKNRLRGSAAEIGETNGDTFHLTNLLHQRSSLPDPVWSQNLDTKKAVKQDFNELNDSDLDALED